MAKMGEFHFDASSLNRIGQKLIKFVKKQIPGAASSALNRTLNYVANNLGKVVAEQYNIKASEFKKTGKGKIVAVRMNYAKKGTLGASITYGGRRLTFVHFQLTPKVPGTGRPIKIKVKKSSGRKAVNTNPKPFIAPTGTANKDKVQYNAFKRVGPKRKPIEVLHTVSAPQMISNPAVHKKVQRIAEEKLLDRVEHEINYRLQKLNVKK